MNKNSKNIDIVCRILSIIFWCIGCIFLFMGEWEGAITCMLSAIFLRT